MKAHYNITGNLLKSLIIFAVISIFTINNSYATGFNFSPRISFSLSDLVASLAPTTPKEADFDDAEAINTSLAPVTPAEADFSDAETSNSDITTLAPVTPVTADFNDAEADGSDITRLAHTIPFQADFND